MFFFSFEYGMETTSWCAELALRTRVSMSAIGSVMVMVGSPPFLTGVSTSAFAAGMCRVVDLRCQRCVGLGCALGSGTGYQELLVTPGSSPA
ncbi:hypothetical protein GCM10028802_18780 [Terrabacter terrigena]